MSRGYDASSEIYSLYSHPVSMTRASSFTQNSEPIATPLDELTLNRRTFKAGEHGPRGKSAEYDDAVRIRLDTPETLHHLPRERQVESIPEEDHQPYGPYFSLPRDPTAAATGLTRRRTAKELIGRYESMDAHSAARPPYSVRPVQKPKQETTGTATEKKDKSRSPIRQSFRNLISVFKKNKTHAREQSEHLAIPGDESRTRIYGNSPAVQSSPRDPPASQLPRLDLSSIKQDISVCTTPLSAHPGLSGPLLYLSRSGAPGIYPVWTNSTAALHSTHILVTWTTSRGSPSPHLVQFTACTDVRSLSLADLDPHERGLLPVPEEGGELKVFELLFEGRPREKFAASSVTERATWVSAIWDAILLVQEQRSEIRSIADTRDESYPDTAPPSSLHIKTNSPITPASATSSNISSVPRLKIDIDRALPKIPASPGPAAPVTPFRVSLKDPGAVRSTRSPVSALSPLPAPPTTPTSSKFLAPPSPARSQSVSIRNLDQLSVVKQRLAEIERNSPVSSPVTHTQSGLSTPSTPVRSRSPLRSELGTMQRQRSAVSNGEGSIIDSYGGGASPVSTLSMYSGRLTEFSSARNTPKTNTDGDGWTNRGVFKSPLLNSPTRVPTIFTLAERYSDEEAEATSYLVPLTMREHMRQHISPPRPLGLPGERVDEPRLGLDLGQDIDPEVLQQERSRSPQDGGKPSTSQDAWRPSSSQNAGSTDLHNILDGIGRSVHALASHSETSGADILDIRAKVHAILDTVQQQTGGGNISGVAAVMEKLEQMRSELNMTPLQNGSGNGGNLKNMGRSGEANPVQLLELHAKVDGLVALCENIPGGGDASAAASGGTAAKIQEIHALLQGAQSQWAAQSTQQTDSIRYLNELNSWLEAFVNHGTSHIENVAAGMQQLCKELGPSDGQIPEDNGEARPGQGSLLGEVRRLLRETQSRENNSAALHESVNGLLVAVQEDHRRNAEARNVLTTESVAGLIEGQRQNHERMLRDIATELSHDIRGERLRFVEAMKEATAINVQIHVEEFKKELTREVLVMTQEVGRLQRERQSIEQQIADLFAFYAKQKKSGGNTRTAQPGPRQSMRSQQPRLQIQVGQTIPGGTIPGMQTQRRPLPSPMVRPRSAYG